MRTRAIQFYCTKLDNITADNNIKNNRDFEIYIINPNAELDLASAAYVGFGVVHSRSFAFPDQYVLEFRIPEDKINLVPDENLLDNSLIAMNIAGNDNTTFVYDKLYLDGKCKKENTNLIFSNFKIKFNSEQDYINKCNELNIPISIPFNYTRSEIDKKFPVLKQFWTNNSNLYSYSTIKINDYLGNQVLNKNDVVSVFLLNYLVYKLNKN